MAEIEDQISQLAPSEPVTVCHPFLFQIRRSEIRICWLVALVPEPSHRDLHPLLLEPDYWRDRLRQQRSVRPFLLLTPRPDLSTGACEVQEIRFQAHDGVRLWGLVGRCPLLRDEQPAALRIVGPCHLPAIDVNSVQLGCTEFVIQSPPGRRLEDRVLDAVRLCEIASRFDSVDADQVGFGAVESLGLPDEARIADGLRASGMIHSD